MQTDFMDLKPIIMPGIKPKSTIAKGGAGVSSVFRKLDDDIDGAPKQKKVDSTSRQELIKARIEKSWTQDQADAQCNFPKHTFKAIENGTLTPTGRLLSKISSVLKVNLKFV